MGSKRARGFPKPTLNRLPLYLRVLSELERKKIAFVSSRQLAELVGTNSAQVRKDLSFLGELGVRGLGYEVTHLKLEISRFLGLEKSKQVVVVGVGRLGSALIGYEGFKKKGFCIIGAFDIDEKKIGQVFSGIEVQPLDELKKFVSRQGTIDIGIIAVPASSAQIAGELLLEAGVKSILNFAPAPLDLNNKIPIRHVDLSVEMQILSYYLSRGKRGKSYGG